MISTLSEKKFLKKKSIDIATVLVL